MLYKKELAELPRLPFRKLSAEEKGKCYFQASIDFQNLPRSGNIVVVDIFRNRDKAFVCRFVSDGNNYLTAMEYPVKAWTGRDPRGISDLRCAAVENDFERLRKMIYAKPNFGSYDAMDAIHDFISDKRWEKRQKAVDAEIELRKKHFAMFPSLPEDLRSYCEEHIFKHGYLFIEKAAKKQRKAHCSKCLQTVSVSSEVVSGKEIECPSCHAKCITRGTWFEGTIQESAKICINAKVDGQLLQRWADVTREFTAGNYRPKYFFDDYAYSLHLKSGSVGEKLYFYKYLKAPYSYGYTWYRRIGETCMDSTYLYTNNLNEVFGDSYYHVDLPRGLSGKDIEINFPKLLNNLRDIPQAEYLFKLGMPMLASQAEYISWPEISKPSFSSMLGVSGNYKDLYREMNINQLEHRFIKSQAEIITADDIRNFRTLKISYWNTAIVESIAKIGRPRQVVGYLSAQQKKLGGKSFDRLLTLYRDYIDMSVALDVDLSNKSVMFPEDIKKAHGQIVPRFNEIKFEAENNLFRKTVDVLYSALNLQPFEKDGFCVAYPQSRTDFIREGQSLNHCVGSEMYYKNHMIGNRMIFFIRKSKAPDKPYFTLEMDMQNYKILQLYGFGDRSADKEVRKFAEAFAKALPVFRKTAQAAS